MGKDVRPLACFHCGCEDKLRPHEHCDCDGDGMVYIPGEDSVACTQCDFHTCGDCFEFLNPPPTEAEGLDYFKERE